MLDFTALEAELTANESVDSSAAALITALANEIEANKDAPAKLQAMADRLRASNASLAAAVAAGTPTA